MVTTIDLSRSELREVHNENPHLAQPTFLTTTYVLLTSTPAHSFTVPEYQLKILFCPEDSLEKSNELINLSLPLTWTRVNIFSKSAREIFF